MRRARFACALYLLLAGITFSVAATFAPAQDKKDRPRYFMCIFAHETNPRAPQSAHTFATFVKADDKAFETHTISWLPKGGEIRLVRPAEPGVNLDLKASLDTAAAMKAQVFEWGPYEIKPELYDRALKQIALLNSGRVLYKAVDLVPQRGELLFFNCIH